MCPSRRLCVPVRCQPLARLFGLVLLVGLTACGSPSLEAPVSGHATEAAGAVMSPPAGDAANAGLAGHEPAGQAPTQMAPLGPPAPHASTPGARSTDASRATSPAHDARGQTATSPADTHEPDEQTTDEQAQREAWQSWFAEMREHPDVTVRLQALEVWAQQPGDTIDPLTYALVDEDEDVRARAQELWEQQLTQEATATQPVPEAGPRGQAEP